MTKKPMQYTQKQQETIDLFRDSIDKAAIKLFQDSKRIKATQYLIFGH